MSIKWFFTVIFLQVIFAGCAADKCSGDQCGSDTDTSGNLDYGMSRFLAVNPKDGEIIWGVDFQGEQTDIVELRDDGEQVVVKISDSCFEKDRTFAFNVKKGNEVPLVDSVDTDVPPDYCKSFTNEQVPLLNYVDGVCVGAVTGESDTDSETDSAQSEFQKTLFRGIDTVDGSVLWEKSYTIDNFVIDYDIFVFWIFVENTDEHRLSRVSPSTGNIMWFHQQPHPMQVIGADKSRIFAIDETLFAMDKNTGDVAWETEIGTWSFKAPDFSDGKLLDDTLFAVRNRFPASPCADTGSN